MQPVPRGRTVALCPAPPSRCPRPHRPFGKRGAAQQEHGKPLRPPPHASDPEGRKGDGWEASPQLTGGMGGSGSFHTCLWVRGRPKEESGGRGGDWTAGSQGFFLRLGVTRPMSSQPPVYSVTLYITGTAACPVLGPPARPEDGGGERMWRQSPGSPVWPLRGEQGGPSPAAGCRGQARR